MLTTNLFEDAYRRFFDRTQGFLRTRGAGPELAEEVAQAAWAKGWERRGQLRDVKAVSPWINSIALNILRQAFKSAGRFVELDDRDAERPAQPANFDLRSALKILSTEDQKLCRMFYMEGFTALELGRRFSMTAPSIRVRLMRARRKMRLVLAGGASVSSTLDSTARAPVKLPPMAMGLAGIAPPKKAPARALLS